MRGKLASKGNWRCGRGRMRPGSWGETMECSRDGRPGRFIQGSAGRRGRALLTASATSTSRKASSFSREPRAPLPASAAKKRLRTPEGVAWRTSVTQRATPPPTADSGRIVLKKSEECRASASSSSTSKVILDSRALPPRAAGTCRSKGVKAKPCVVSEGIHHGSAGEYNVEKMSFSTPPPRRVCSSRCATCAGVIGPVRVREGTTAIPMRRHFRATVCGDAGSTGTSSVGLSTGNTPSPARCTAWSIAQARFRKSSPSGSSTRSSGDGSSGPVSHSPGAARPSLRGKPSEAASESSAIAVPSITRWSKLSSRAPVAASTLAPSQALDVSRWDVQALSPREARSTSTCGNKPSRRASASERLGVRASNAATASGVSAASSRDKRTTWSPPSSHVMAAVRTSASWTRWRASEPSRPRRATQTSRGWFCRRTPRLSRYQRATRASSTGAHVPPAVSTPNGCTVTMMRRERGSVVRNCSHVVSAGTTWVGHRAGNSRRHPSQKRTSPLMA
ncbi:hypothetical protein MXAN_2347 [Myxococcus xanthus DK 1622]|uniref:Uncharacterized protein n=1 Tax=Myxococcus xanthus (strain DK1622) TaxID=246197 RepID=Q1D9V6_MYXXD|nr:hypothetical protein MXAN_2347 [Myxococcus xanthus DK 1622]